MADISRNSAHCVFPEVVALHRDEKLVVIHFRTGIKFLVNSGFRFPISLVVCLSSNNVHRFPDYVDSNAIGATEAGDYHKDSNKFSNRFSN